MTLRFTISCHTPCGVMYTRPCMAIEHTWVFEKIDEKTLIYVILYFQGFVTFIPSCLTRASSVLVLYLYLTFWKNTAIYQFTECFKVCFTLMQCLYFKGTDAIYLIQMSVKRYRI